MREELVPVFIDHNVWHLLFRDQLDLCSLLPQQKFGIWITREGEIEAEGAPPELKQFIKETIARCGVQVDEVFGFDQDGVPPDKRRYPRWGRWAREEELDFHQGFKIGPGEKGSGLKAKEGDRALAARAQRALILTGESKRKGPVKSAFRAAQTRGWPVVYWRDYEESGKSLEDVIETAWGERRRPSTC